MLLDVMENVKNLCFFEFDVVQLFCVLVDIDVVVININYVLEVGLNLEKDVIVIENVDGFYVNIIVVCIVDKDVFWVKIFVEFYNFFEVKKYIQDKYIGVVILVW